MAELKEREEISSTVDDSMYNVVMFNDDVTPVEYVVMVLCDIFGYDRRASVNTMMHVHMNGKGVIATTSMEKAYSKVEEVDKMNEQYGFLLQTNVEKA